MKYFGTDGIRGTYADLEISEPFFYALGLAVADYIKENNGGKVVVGGDTRASTESLKNAFCLALSESEIDFEDVSVLPTPALAYAVLQKNAKLGAMITASHNPYNDNGIKFFDQNARKIEDETQEWLENRLEKYLDKSAKYTPKTFEQKPIVIGNFAKNEYVAKMSSIFPQDFLKGKKIVIDMANGATSSISSEVFKRYAAEVFEIGCEPNGFNINDNIGSQHPDKMIAMCKAVNADVGFAHDGDGDRVVVADDNGDILEGEEIMGLIALDAKARGILHSDAIVTTIQSNMGMDDSLKSSGISVFRSGIGDRLVMREMLARFCNIGGENSGHFIFSEISPCGDGLAAALAVLAVLDSKKSKLSNLRGDIKMYPQLSKAISVARKTPIEETENLSKAIVDCEAILSTQGRLLVRYSGTEKKIRLLVEGKFEDKIQECMKILQKSVELDLQ